MARTRLVRSTVPAPRDLFPTNGNNPAVKLPHCAVIRPSDDKFAGAVATIASFTADGLFKGQSPEFFKVVNQLAQAADAAERQG